MSTLKNSTITVPTIRGSIKATYTANESGKSYEIEIPGNMVAEFQVNHEKVQKWMYTGREMPIHSQPLQLTSGKHQIKMETSS